MIRRRKPDGTPDKRHRQKAGVTFYTKELGEMICALIIDGKTLRQIELLDGMPARRTIAAWLHRHPDFAEMYDRAREIQGDHMDDLIVECAEKANSSNFQAMRVKIQAYQWRASKLNPKRYGETQRHEHKGQLVISRNPEDDKMQ